MFSECVRTLGVVLYVVASRVVGMFGLTVAHVKLGDRRTW